MFIYTDILINVYTNCVSYSVFVSRLGFMETNWKRLPSPELSLAFGFFDRQSDDIINLLYYRVI